MAVMLNFVVLVISTVLAAAAAVALDWVLLRAAFRMMTPATAARPQRLTSELVRGTRELARHLAPTR